MATARNKGEITPLPDGSLDFADVLEMIRQGIKIHLVESESDNERVAAEILDRTLGATSADDLFDDGGTTKVSEILNQPIHIFDVKFRNADENLDSRLGIYAIVFAKDQGGSTLTITSGADKVVVKLIKALQLDALPRWLKFTANETAAGNKVYDLVGTKPPVGADGF